MSISKEPRSPQETTKDDRQDNHRDDHQENLQNDPKDDPRQRAKQAVLTLTAAVGQEPSAEERDRSGRHPERWQAGDNAGHASPGHSPSREPLPAGPTKEARCCTGTKEKRSL